MIPKTPLLQSLSEISEADRRRRKRECIIIIAIIAVVTALTFAENRVIHFGADFPVSNTILMFVLININLLLLLLLIFLVFRNLVKLLYDRKRNVMGAKLRTRLVVTFISLTLLPAVILFFFSINFITSSIAFWFNVPVEQALENSINVGRRLYSYTEENNRFFLEQIACQIQTKNYLAPEKLDELSHYIQVAQRSFNIHAVEVYAQNYNRISLSVSPQLEQQTIEPVSRDSLRKNPEKMPVRSISQAVDSGELIRTIGTVPFGEPHAQANAFVVLSVLIPPDLSAHMASISRGVEQYQQIKLMKKPIQVTYYITLSIVGLLVVFCAIWFGFYLAKTISIPLMELAEGTRRVAEGDLSVSISRVADDEIGTLVESFNKMTRDLRNSREQLQLSAHKLQEQNAEIEERRQYMEIVLKNVSAGVITLNANGIITTINTSAEKMLTLKSSEILNKSYKNLLKTHFLDMTDELIETLSVSRSDAVERPLKLKINGRPRSFLVHVNALKNDMGNHIGIVMVFDDLTELEKAQRMAAWREVARRIAHEVKNPLTPISLSAQRLQRKYSGSLNEKVFDECTQMIIDHVDLIRNIVNEFSAFARFPTASPLSCQLPPIINETIALYKEGHPDIHFDFHLPDQIPELKIDRKQIKQVFINLIDNAVSALKEQGCVMISLSHDPILNLIRVEIADNGPGITDELKTRLFEPYFSTKSSGMGLGLTIVNTIITDHNGMIRVQDNQPRGAKFIIELPT
ncbi:MAG: ATP-binding protein [Desulfobacterales bacterium]|nr:ATP-binding protein [Desulfobacterales bacterium]MDD4070933.1 ATP-binding protein [Desulfobacterales bacterium]MDD4393441.1 ATP-binding protein [Desulfobacterales bacterium]